MVRTVFVGGRVWTAGLCDSRPLEVLVTGNQITRVARAGELDRAGAEVVDLRGGLLIPGFQDAHIHPGIGGSDLLRCNLLGLDTADQIVSAISDYSQGHPELDWITGGGWLQRAFDPAPTRELLDGLVGGRKAVLHAHSRHSAWASSAALAAAGIDEHTPDPPHGRIDRDDQGRPSGMLHEDAMLLLAPAIPAPTLRDRTHAILSAETQLLRLGITSIQDALVGTGLGLQDHHDAYVGLLGEGGLHLRVTTALWWDPTRGIDQIAELQERRRALETVAPESRIIADTVKMMIDGAGLVFMERDAILEAIVALDAVGFTVHSHSYGEASTRDVLDAVAEARKSNPGSPGRHHIAHLMVIDEDDFERFGALGVTANIQGFWGDRPVVHEMLQPSQLSHDPHQREYAFARLHTAGARLAAGSDWPVSSANPLDAIDVASSRVTRDEERRIDELDRLDVASVLAAYTAGSAFVNGRGNSTGRIARGFLADLAVLDRDILEPDADISGARVQQTWIDGKRVV